MKITTTILLLASVVQYVNTVSNGSYCTAGSTPSRPTDPPFPDLPKSFQTRLEANFIDRGVTMEAAEYADDDGNRAALTVVRGGDLTHVVFDYKAGQVYTVHDGVCVTKTMSNDTSDMYLFGDISINGAGHIFSTNDIIKFAKSYGETYMGQSEVRGINCDKWRTCMYWDYFKANFTLDYYFSALNWTTSMTYPQVPVRADVTGIMRTTSGQRNFHHIYDYYDFRPGIEPGLTVFETPSNVVCPNRKSLKLIPKVANQFYLRFEETNVPDAHTVNIQAWYDKEYKVVRVDFADQGRPSIHIDDFNRGTRYTIDKEYGSCSMTSLPDTVVDSKRVGKDNHWFLELLEPLEFLRLQANFVYVGQRTVRGLNCDLFVAMVTGESAVFYTNTAADNVTVEAYFSRSSNESADTGVPGDKEVYSHVLVQIITYVNQTQLDTIMNFYDFDFGHPDPVKTFDLTPCFTDGQQIRFSVRFPVDEAPDLLPYDILIQNEALKALSVGLQLEPTRLQHLHVHADDDNVYVSGKLIDRPPLLARYYVTPNQSLEVVDAQHNGMSVGKCATFCDVKTDCVSFAFCNNVCYLSHLVQQYSVNPALTADCDRYSAVVQRPKGLPDLDLHDAWSAFKTLVSADSLTLQLSIPSYPNLDLVADEVLEDDIWRQGRQDKTTDSWTTAVATTSDVTTSEVTTPAAESNTPTSQPETTTEIPGTSPEVTTPSKTTKLRSTRSSSFPTTVTPTPTTKWTQTTMPLPTTQHNGFILYKRGAFFNDADHAMIINSVEECLADCLQDTVCRSVTVCVHENKCIISRVSPAMHVNLVKPNPGCDIYSLASNNRTNVSTTFTPSRQNTSPSPVCPTSPTGTTVKGFNLVAGFTVPGIAKTALELIPTFQTCGTACTKAEFHCTAFQYCPSNKICNLFDNRLLPIPLTLRTNITCPYYTRQILDDFTLQTVPPAPNSNFIPLNGASLETCADMCGHEGPSCIAFQYCLNTKVCLIGTTQTVNVVYHQAKSGCQYYKRPLPPGGQSPNPQPLGSAGYSGGSLAGMAVGMLIVGILVGVAVLFLIIRQRKRKSFDVDMHILEK